MPTGTVNSRGTSKKGKPTITIDGALYYAGGTDLGGLMTGDTVEFTCTSFADGKLWGIDKGWKLVNGAQKYPQQPIPSNGIASPAPSVGVPVNRLGAPVTDQERPCVTNLLNALITEKLITDPASLGIWTAAIKEAFRSDLQFQTDKDIPFDFKQEGPKF